jgi:D-glycero-alpha-D-manno-heptose-7-phosphate kinase
MIITRTPYRISFFGGGTDYPDWFRAHGGSVISTTIDKYCYIFCRKLPPFFEHKHRIVYSKIETVQENHEIRHPSVRAVFEWAGIEEGLEVHHDGDLPARSGIGSSSSFTVGLVKAIYALRSQMISSIDLAHKAIHIEQNVIGENVGSQDQIAAAFGGLNKIDFLIDGSFKVTPVIISPERKFEFHSHLMLFFTGKSRIADQIARSKIENLPFRQNELHEMKNMVDTSIEILSNDKIQIIDFGKMLHENWKLKRSLSDRITTYEIDMLYQTALDQGAIGGKILGAGGGGFMLLFAEPHRHSAIRKALSHLVQVDFQFENAGSQIVFYQTGEA